MSYPTEPTEEEIRKRVEDRLEERQGVVYHAIAFVIVNAFIIGAWVMAGADGFPGPFVITFFWGIGMVAHILSYYYEHGEGRVRREAYIQREMERERERLYSAYGGKPKNDALYTNDEEDALDPFLDEDDIDYQRR
jgi:hypothetical protein